MYHLFSQSSDRRVLPLAISFFFVFLCVFSCPLLFKSVGEGVSKLFISIFFAIVEFCPSCVFVYLFFGATWVFKPKSDVKVIIENIMVYYAAL